MEAVAIRYQDLISSYTKIPVEVIISKSRKEDIREARQLLMFFLRTYAGMTLKKTGIIVGGMKYSTVLCSCRKVEEDFNTNKIYQKKYSELLNKAKSLKKELDLESTGIHIYRPGDMCWFWNNVNERPIIGIFQELDKAGKLAYAEGFFAPFRNWLLAESYDAPPVEKMRSICMQVV